MIVASGLLAILVGGAFGLLLLALDDERESAQLATDSQEVLVAANRLERLVIDLETGERGFVLTRDEQFLQPWDAARRALPQASADLQRLPVVPIQRSRVNVLIEAIASYLRDYSMPLVDAARRNDSSIPGLSPAEGKRRVDQLRDQFDELVETERGLAATRQSRARRATERATRAAAGGLAGSIVLILLFSAYLTRAIVRPVRRASAMAAVLAAGDLTVRMPESGVGEIGALERSFNTMGTALEVSRKELTVLFEQQAALRRVATSVARGVSPEEVFESVAGEVRRLLRANSTRLLRYEPDGTATVVAGSSEPDIAVPVGTRFTLEGDNIPAMVLRTGLPARMDALDAASGSAAAVLRDLGIRSAVGAPVVVEGCLWGVMVAAWTEHRVVSEQEELRIVEFTDLVATAIANADSRAELNASRARVVAAADDTRRRIERDLHDGIQQRLVSLALEFRAAEAAVPEESRELREQLSRTAKGLSGVVEELQEVSRGIHPAILSKGGLRPALRTLARRSSVPVELAIGLVARLPEPVEVAAYYVVSEALTNAAKHAQASAVEVSVEAGDSVLRISVTDDGVGGAELGRGSGLVGLRDRIEALGGRIEIASPVGRGTSLVVTIPVDGR